MHLGYCIIRVIGYFRDCRKKGINNALLGSLDSAADAGIRAAAAAEVDYRAQQL